MPTVHIETQPISANTYDLIQTWVGDGNSNLDERLYTEVHEDRMYAAMTNLGKACRWLVDCKVDRGAVCIVSDQDGKDKRYGGEHDDLFEAIYDPREYQRNRAKYSLIYGKYVSYLDRIRELADVNEIVFSQNATAVIEIARGKEFTAANAAEVVRPGSFYTRDTLLLLNLSGARNMVTCRHCGKSIMYAQTDNFAAYPVWSDDGKRRKLIKNNKQAVAWFLESHCRIHQII